MRHLLLCLTIAALSLCASLARAKPIDDPIYSSTRCSLLRIDPADGSARELLKIDHASLTAPAALADWLFVGDDAGTLHALCLRDGAKSWELKAERGITCVAATDKTVFSASNVTLQALDAATGHPLWARKSDVPISSITLVDGTAIINTFDGPVALDQTTGVPRWQLEVKWERFTYSPLPDKRLCVWKPDEIFVVATDSGKTLWHKAADQSSSAPGALPTAAVAGGDLICQLRGSPANAEEWSLYGLVGSSRVDLQACKLEYSIVSPK